MNNRKQPIFLVQKESDKESTGEQSIKNKNDINFIFSGQKESFSDFCLGLRNNDIFFKTDEISMISHDLFSNEDFNLSFVDGENIEFKKNSDLKKLFGDYNNTDEITFEKNRNYLNDNLIIQKEKEKEDIDDNNPINKCNRCDSLLIKFKAFFGKWFINQINNKLKLLRKKLIIKRGIKFYSFNYKKFTIKVSYNLNKQWLKDKMKDLLLLGDEENQIKNEKGIKSIYRRNLPELNEIKDLLESTYEDVIKKFYLSEEFNVFKEDKRVKDLNYNFSKIMKMSLLEKFGFIEFLETRKGNNRKESS